MQLITTPIATPRLKFNHHYSCRSTFLLLNTGASSCSWPGAVLRASSQPAFAESKTCTSTSTLAAPCASCLCHVVLLVLLKNIT